MFDSAQDANEFFKFLNSHHPNIKLTLEKQKEDKLAFLDILISNTYQIFCTSDYRKMNLIGLHTNFVSLIHYSYKIGLIKTLIHPMK